MFKSYTNLKACENKLTQTLKAYGERFPWIWMKLGEKISYKPPGASYTAQGPQKQSEIIKNQLFMFYQNY